MQTTTAHIRWMVREDMPHVLRIEHDSFPDPWTDEDFMRRLRQRNCFRLVAEVNEQVVGFMVYELHKSHLHVLNFAVCPYCRRHGIGEAMANKLVKKLSTRRLGRIILKVRETNLDAQLFFRQMGFKAVSVLRECYDGCSEDAYVFEYRFQAYSAIHQQPPHPR